MKKRLSRRTFLKSGLKKGAFISAPAFVPAVVLGVGDKPGANERIQIGVVGMGARGQNLVGNLPDSAQAVAICDCSKSRLRRFFKPKGKFKKILAPFLSGDDAQKLTQYQDVRDLLEHQKLDGMMIATPDHNHAWIALRALTKGLDLYLEKPLTTTIADGRKVVEATKLYKRIVQVGSQQRSMELNRFACEFIRSGITQGQGLGKISHIDARNLPGPLIYHSFPKEDQPDDLDWNLFCGPTPLRPYNKAFWIKDEYKVGKILWRGWDFWKDYSGHLVTNWGAHSFDMVQYALGEDRSGPVEIEVQKPTQKELQKMALEWANKTPVDPHLGLASENQRRFWPVTLRYRSGIELRLRSEIKRMCFHGENGKLFISRNKFSVDPPELVRDPPDPSLAKRWQGVGIVARPHIQNWLDCIKTRSQPHAPVEVGHRSNTVCLLINIARELGKNLRWNPKTEQFVGDEKANLLLQRTQRKEFRI